MRKTFISVCCLFCLVLLVRNFEASVKKEDTFITVSAGAIDRQESVVEFTLPKQFTAKGYALRDESGSMIQLQIDSERHASFVLRNLNAKTTRRYRLEEFNVALGSSNEFVKLTREGDRLSIKIGDRQILGYQAQPSQPPSANIKPIFKRGGYIYPVYSPSGRNLTDDYPPDHFHHHGIWFAWTKTEFEGRHPDFWNMGDGTGTVLFDELDQTWSGPIDAGFKARNSFVDVSAPTAKTVLDEEWQVVVYNVGRGSKPYTMFDLVSTQKLKTPDPLVLPEYRYGGMGYRGPREWLPKDNFFFLTSEGKDRNDGNGTRAKWCHMSGKVDGQITGIAILDHPSNFRSPQPIRINPDQPFFCYSPSVMGEWKIDPGTIYTSRYRYIVSDGPANKEELDRMWNDYANPPEVIVGRAQ
jgi:hypothetical protein